MSATQRKSFAVICLVASIVVSVSATIETESANNNVELTIYQMSVSQWETSLASFKSEVAAQTVTYCTANYDSCGLDSTSTITFLSSYVKVYSNPEEKSRSLKVSIYIEFDSLKTLKANPPTQFVVNSAAVKAILEGSMASLETVLNHEITYVGETFYSIPPAKKANEIIIPMAFVVLLGIICLAIGLHMWKKRKEEAEKKKLKSEKRSKKTGRVRPLHGVEDEAQSKQASNFWPRRFRKKRTVQVRMESLDEEAQRPRPANGHIPTLSIKTNMTEADMKNPASMEKLHYEDRVLARNDALPPLPSLDQKCVSEDEKEQEKRDKKEKKRRKKEKRRQEMQESGVESESEKSRCESHGKNVVPVEA